MTGVYALVIALAVVVVLLGLLVVGLLRSHADILRRLDALGAGVGDGHSHGNHITLTRRTPTEVKDVRTTGITPDGEPLVTSLVTGEEPTLLAFLSTTCSSCTPFWEGLDRPRMRFGGQPHRVLVVTLGESEESPSRAQTMSKPGVDVVMSSSAWSDFEVPGAPYFVLVEPATGRIVGEGSAMTYASLEEFLTDAGNDQRWDLEMSERSDDEESRVDAELRKAGLVPGDPRLYPEKGEISEDGAS